MAHDSLHVDRVHDYRLDEWVDEFAEVYGVINRTRSAADIWMHVVAHSGSIHEDVRLSDYAKAFDHISRVFCWLCAFVKYVGVQDKALPRLSPFGEIVLSKFPDRCFYCDSKSVCVCHIEIGARIEDVAHKQAQKNWMRSRALGRHRELVADGVAPVTLSDFVRMFGRLYGPKNFDLPINIIVAHFQEEIGEVSQAITDMLNVDLLGGMSRLDQRDLEDEIADVFAWLIALYLKCEYIVKITAKYLDVPQHALLKDGFAGHVRAVYFDEATQQLVDPSTGARPVRPRPLQE